uniref:peptidyl-tRNA hydrolase n=1 Tax=Chromera velia CCMP2878 TaxID=1169474 RepID=A0A0G4HI83_9ALVE|mmetsp:Transcript_36959/g.72679  ORF Transcript_36959/g.72679 Transcript_36959/m.72679 type:complete len:213 (+) Transcript_36959:225-863(+)|eukprot:Cvel_6956.t1-p1 / transcript=Cvel_6956.t1 / gene=Cvel_6956 / organism=Chromera_velia_CCMP2878 / gene_product=Peptidyl-tRNA hydrolase 2, mitochondrial, putative / transcript_product=Peptidyl-tRNA hydrolase 2, mitochondrial, putative / location=Cvel_scaffold352:85434-88545(-) / protein_length=212 / sequence_SO=supercontig / SO=protein_coding / is_pseudo=false
MLTLVVAFGLALLFDFLFGNMISRAFGKSMKRLGVKPFLSSHKASASSSKEKTEDAGGKEKRKAKEGEKLLENSSSEEEDESDDEGDVRCKMVLIVRSDLQMGKGKIAAQCGHATLGAYKKALRPSVSARRGDWLKHLRTWERTGQAKVVLKCADEGEMFRLTETAAAVGLLTHVVADAGRTQVDPGSYTVLAIGPGPEAEVSSISGHLKLL